MIDKILPLTGALRRPCPPRCALPKLEVLELPLYHNGKVEGKELEVVKSEKSLELSKIVESLENVLFA